MKRPALQNERVGVLRTAFRARKVFGTFEKRATGLQRKAHEVSYTLYSTRRQMQKPNPNVRNNPDTNPTTHDTNRYLRLNGALRVVYLECT